MLDLKSKAIAILTGLLLMAVVCVSGLVIGYHTGVKRANAAAELREAKAVALALKEQAATNDRILAGERKLRADNLAEYSKYIEGAQDASNEKDKLIAGLRRDVVRLRVPIHIAKPAGDPGASGSTAAGPGEEGHAELTADASEFLVDLLARGDEGIRKHAVVVDMYEKLRLSCNSQGGQ